MVAGLFGMFFLGTRTCSVLHYDAVQTGASSLRSGIGALRWRSRD